VALVDFDQELYAARLRADEQALWLATRCAMLFAGRPRGETRLVVQTHAPGHPVVRAIADAALAEAQTIDLAERVARGLPPARAQALLTGDLPAVDAAVAGLAMILGEGVTVKGPSGSGSRRRALVEHDDVDALTGTLADVASGARLEGKLRVEMDPGRA
jgi:primosomal protein N' (replication factor Y)